MRLRFSLTVFLLLAATAIPALAQQQRWGRPHPPRAGACFYRDAHFYGDYFCMSAGDRWGAMPRGFNDVISSIRVYGGARVQIFRDGNFQGAGAFVDRDVDDMLYFNSRETPGLYWNDQVSSLIVVGGDRGHDRDRDRDRQHPY
jgi:hypothetical protein